MKFEQQIQITVNGKTIQATVQVSAPGLEREDCLNAQMILAAVASGRKTEYHSRHHKDRVATIEACKARVEPRVTEPKQVLRLVA